VLGARVAAPAAAPDPLFVRAPRLSGMVVHLAIRGLVSRRDRLGRVRLWPELVVSALQRGSGALLDTNWQLGGQSWPFR
jgi:hypothetical protein